jgi:hypothetical protein
MKQRLFHQKGGDILGKGAYGAATTFPERDALLSSTDTCLTVKYKEHPEKYVSKVFINSTQEKANQELIKEKHIHDTIKDTLLENILYKYIIVYTKECSTDTIVTREDIHELKKTKDDTSKELSSTSLILPKGENSGYTIFNTCKNIIQLKNRILYLIHIIQAVNFLKRYKIYHEDIKLENVMLHNYRMKLIDFGLTIVLNDNISLPISTANTLTSHNLCPSYLSYVDLLSRDETTGKMIIEGNIQDIYDKIYLDRDYYLNIYYKKYEEQSHTFDTLEKKIEFINVNIPYRWQFIYISILFNYIQTTIKGTIDNKEYIENYLKPIIYYIYYVFMDMSLLDFMIPSSHTDEDIKKYEEMINYFIYRFTPEHANVIIKKENIEFQNFDEKNEKHTSYDPFYHFLNKRVLLTQTQNHHLIFETKQYFQLCILFFDVWYQLEDKKWKINDTIKKELFIVLFDVIKYILLNLLNEDFKLEIVIHKLFKYIQLLKSRTSGPQLSRELSEGTISSILGKSTPLQNISDTSNTNINISPIQQSVSGSRKRFTKKQKTSILQKSRKHILRKHTKLII